MFQTCNLREICQTKGNSHLLEQYTAEFHDSRNHTSDNFLVFKLLRLGILRAFPLAWLF